MGLLVEHKEKPKEVPLLLHWHMQFFLANNDACLVEHEEQPKEVPLLLQWHMQFFLINNEACQFPTCSFSSDQVLHLCFYPCGVSNHDHHHHNHPHPLRQQR
jgi:hypothetical protein